MRAKLKAYLRYLEEEVTLERKISLVFFFSGIVAAVASIIVYIMQETPFFLQLPTYLTLVVCVAIPLRFKADDYTPTIVLMVYVLYLYLPYAYFTSGALDSPASLFFVMGIFMFSFILKGKAKSVALVLLVLEHSTLLFIGAYVPSFEYTSTFMKGLDFSFSYIIIALIAIMVTSIITLAHRAEQDKIQKLLEELREKNLELESLSIIDPLTGCYNRRHLSASCESIISEHTANHMYLSVFMIDIDHFKVINDTYGHTIGDDILKLTVNTIRSAIRLNDLLVRYGGEEFVIVLPNCGGDIAIQIAERIRASIENIRHRGNIRYTVSVGIAELEEQDDLQTLIDRADASLYRAKNEGRNRVCF